MPFLDSYMETRLDEIEEQLFRESPLAPNLRQQAYELLLIELYS